MALPDDLMDSLQELVKGIQEATKEAVSEVTVLLSRVARKAAKAREAREAAAQAFASGASESSRLSTLADAAEAKHKETLDRLADARADAKILRSIIRDTRRLLQDARSFIAWVAAAQGAAAEAA